MSDASRIPITSATRGRLARTSNVSRIPQRTSNIPTTRRASRNRADLEPTPTKPRRDSGIPGPRRLSKPGETPDTPSRLSRTPAKQNSTRNSVQQQPLTRVTSFKSPATTTPTAIRTPRRTSRASSNPTNLTPHAEKRRLDEENRTTPLLSTNSHRRTSSTSEELRKPASKFTTKFSSSRTAESARRRVEERGLPDRGTYSISQPSPTANKTHAGTTGVQRPALKASPYARRTSAGGSGRITTAGVSRKLNMAPIEEADDTPVKRRTTPSSTTARRLSSARDTSLRGQERYKMDRVERDQRDLLGRRRESGSKRGAQNALESFRAVRRASLESNEAAEKETSLQIDMEPLQRESYQELQPTHLDKVTSAHPMQSGNHNMSLDEMELKETKEEPLPDRPDPITPTAKTPSSKTPAKSRRSSERFSEANICLDNVDKLRLSLGRRRSRGINEDISMIETPKLKRSSFGKGGFIISQRTEDEDKLTPGRPAEESGGLYRVTRSPLQSIATNRRNEHKMGVINSMYEKMGTSMETSRRLSNVPELDDEEAWAREDVEDLGAW